MSDIVKHLRSGETCAVHFDVCPMMNAESGCLCAMAADSIEAYRAEVDRLTFALSDARMEIATLKATQGELVEALELLTDNIEQAFPALANLGPLVQARAALAKAKQP